VSANRESKGKKTPSFIEPMKALPVEKLPEGDWLYEIKHDGYRALAFKDSKEVRLVSRNKKAFDYRQLLDSLKSLLADRVILDGEIAALDEKGRSSFQLLQLFKLSGDVPLAYYVFDLLSLEGKDLRNQSLSARREALANLLKNPPDNIRVSDELRGSKEDLIRVAQEFGLEGLVAKKPDSVYESGRRSGAWVKFKITKSQEFAIGGYTLPEGARSHFGSLLVGYNTPGGLVFAGRVGTGFSEKTLANLYAKFQKLRMQSCPFINLPEKSRGRWGLRITPAVMQRCHWLRPVLVAQVKFTEWTHDDQLRQPVFLGLRTDKEAKEVVRE
jgi:bifunctional non-homologous end joining protein LigD